MEPLDMYRFPDCWELDVERGSFSWCRANVYFSRMLFDNSVAHGKPKPRAAPARFRGKKWIENLVDVFPRNPSSRVHNLDLHASVVCRRLDFQHTSRRHCVARIQEEIQEDLLQFV